VVSQPTFDVDERPCPYVALGLEPLSRIVRQLLATTPRVDQYVAVAVNIDTALERLSVGNPCEVLGLALTALVVIADLIAPVVLPNTGRELSHGQSSSEGGGGQGIPGPLDSTSPLVRKDSRASLLVKIDRLSSSNQNDPTPSSSEL
jgi:hypothetical protein